MEEDTQSEPSKAEIDIKTAMSPGKSDTDDSEAEQEARPAQGNVFPGQHWASSQPFTAPFPPETTAENSLSGSHHLKAMEELAHGADRYGLSGPNVQPAQSQHDRGNQRAPENDGRSPLNARLSAIVEPSGCESGSKTQCGLPVKSSFSHDSSDPVSVNQNLPLQTSRSYIEQSSGGGENISLQQPLPANCSSSTSALASRNNWYRDAEPTPSNMPTPDQAKPGSVAKPCPESPPRTLDLSTTSRAATKTEAASASEQSQAKVGCDFENKSLAPSYNVPSQDPYQSLESGQPSAPANYHHAQSGSSQGYSRSNLPDLRAPGPAASCAAPTNIGPDHLPFRMYGFPGSGSVSGMAPPFPHVPGIPPPPLTSHERFPPHFSNSLPPVAHCGAATVPPYFSHTMHPPAAHRLPPQVPYPMTSGSHMIPYPGPPLLPPHIPPACVSRQMSRLSGSGP